MSLTAKGRLILKKFNKTYKDKQEALRIFLAWKTETNQKGLGVIPKKKK